jgi:hypothetical protein
MTNSEVAALVSKHLEDRHLDDISFVVDEANIRSGDNWWRVPVRPSRLPERLFTFFELLAGAEEEIREQEGRNILLMTGEPLEGETTALARAA